MHVFAGIGVPPLDSWQVVALGVLGGMAVLDVILLFVVFWPEGKETGR